jgi:hypothetical protein
MRGETLPPVTVVDGALGYFLGGRFIPRMAGGETPPNPGEGDPPKGSDDPPTGKDGQPFDATRAQATIETLRASENDLKKQLKDGGKKLSDLEQRLQAFEDKDKSEVEKAAGERDKAKQQLSETETRLRAMAIRVSVAETAAAAGIAPENVKAALRLLDASTIELDDGGEPKNTEAALKALVKEFPMLAVGKDDEAAGKKGVPPTGRANTNGTTTQDIDQRVQHARASGAYPRF